MSKDKIQMPASTGGIVRYFEDYKSKYSIKPHYVIVMILFVIAIILLLHKYGPKLV